ncbi:hypothetical protein [Pseudomonas migulae]|uniref:hypothetical protein n=1 Tax=Pseudomonas migulae TaxID=78543 RepID=UPI000A03D40A|nr:hypothetical protein [Pseudomonas migulae]
MEIDLPLGYWLKNTSEGHFCIGFQYGGHMGGECEIFLPRSKFQKFCSDDEWRNQTINRFYKIVFLAIPELNVPIPETEAKKDGVVPDDWA